VRLMTIKQRRLEPAPAPLPAVPSLPTAIKLLDGKEYSVAGDVWFLPEEPDFPATLKFNWELLSGIITADGSIPVMAPRSVHLVKLYLLERMCAAQNSLKPRSAQVILKAMLDFARGLAVHPEWSHVGRGFDWSDLTEDMFRAWLRTEYKKKRKGNSAARVRCFYAWGADTGFPDFSPGLASILGNMHLKKSATGKLVESRDPRRGAFTREEMNLIFKTCNAGLGDDRGRALAWVLLETGIRPKQIYLLKNVDLKANEVTLEGYGLDDVSLEAQYQLRVRKIKQRGNAIKYHYLPISEGCARELLNLRSPGSGPDDRLFSWLSPSYWVTIQANLRAFAKRADLRSFRLPIANPAPGGPRYELLHMTARRFRYSLATDRIDRGDTIENVAEMLGHKGTKSVDIYVETSSKIAVDFQHATDCAIAPLVDLMERRINLSDAPLRIGINPPVPAKQRSYADAPIFERGRAARRGRRELDRRQPAYFPDSQDSWQSRSEARLKDLIRSARRCFHLIYPGQDFDNQVWDIAHLRERPNSDGAKYLGFTTLASTGYRLSRQPSDALPAYFAETIKSWIVISNEVSPGFNAARLKAAKHLWNFLSTRYCDDTAPFSWAELDEAEILGFEQYLITYRTKRNEPLNPNTIIGTIKCTLSLVDFLASHGICRRINYVTQTQQARRIGRPLEEKELIAQRKLPAPGVLELLADIYYRLTKAPAGEVSDWMLILISGIAILMLTGLRIGELVTLPFDCEVENQSPEARSDGSGACRYGIRYWLEKTEEETLRIRWISPTAERVVRASVARIKRLTAAARERAKVLESDPTKVTLPPELASRNTLTRQELLPLIGQRVERKVVTDPHGLLPQYGQGSESFYYVKDLEAYLLSRRVPHLYTVRHADDTVQRLSESLFIIFAKQSRCSQMNPCRLLVEPVKAGSIASYLSRPNGIFKTYGIKDWQRELSANPHSFRHWLIHIAYKGGMPTRLILRYFAKRSACSIADYLHFSTDENDYEVPEELSGMRFYVPV
jgi:integrase